jgi:hypothetical protein
MQFLVASLLAATASAHYTFPALIAGGVTTPQWQYVRKTSNYQSNGPVTDVSSSQIRCYELAPGTAAQTYTVNAGDSVGFTAVTGITHPGPMQVYMAKAPTTAAAFDGSGAVWFKIFSEPAIITSSSISWASSGMSFLPSISPLPPLTPSKSSILTTPQAKPATQ